jgi:pantoate--beta-alanine ligase
LKSLQLIAFASKMTELSRALRAEGKTIGFVPTMGALHEGHLSLIDCARAECDVVVASIFVNPTQFNDPKDFEKYPRTVDEDVALLGARGCDIVFVPDSVSEVFPTGYQHFEIDFGGFATVMEGAHRPGHFKGVANVVYRLLGIVEPDKAFFGLKDYQQYTIVRQLVKMKGLPVEITGIRTGRADSGLALSSRNQLLNAVDKAAAAGIYEALQLVKQHYGTKKASELAEMGRKFFSEHPEFELEYFEIADGDTLMPLKDEEIPRRPMAFVAARIGNVRLIDNIFLKD